DAPDRDEQAIGLDRGAVAEVDHEPRRDPDGVRPKPERDPVLLEAPTQERRGVRVLARKDAWIRVDDRDARAQPREELAELAADGAGAEDREADRRLRRRRRLAVRPDALGVDALHGRQARVRAGGDDEGVVRELAVADGDDARPRDAALTPDDGHPP